MSDDNEVEVPVGGARQPLGVLQQIALWIEGLRPGWREKGVDCLEHQGAVVLPVYGLRGYMKAYSAVYVAPIEVCNSFPPRESEFVKIDVDAEMSLEHAKVLIETAVESVAGR